MRDCLARNIRQSTIEIDIRMKMTPAPDCMAAGRESDNNQAPARLATAQ